MITKMITDFPLFLKIFFILLYYIIVKKNIKKIINKFATFLRLLFFCYHLSHFQRALHSREISLLFFLYFSLQTYSEVKISVFIFFSISSKYFFFTDFKKKKRFFSTHKKAPKWGVPFFRWSLKNQIFYTFMYWCLFCTKIFSVRHVTNPFFLPYFFSIL